MKICQQQYIKLFKLESPLPHLWWRDITKQADMTILDKTVIFYTKKVVVSQSIANLYHSPIILAFSKKIMLNFPSNYSGSFQNCFLFCHWLHIEWHPQPYLFISSQGLAQVGPQTCSPPSSSPKPWKLQAFTTMPSSSKSLFWEISLMRSTRLKTHLENIWDWFATINFQLSKILL